MFSVISSPVEAGREIYFFTIENCTSLSLSVIRRWFFSSLLMTGTDILSFQGIRSPGVDRVRTTIKLVRVE
jgi:hypothetical protein